ncbi:MopE-related protein [Myxococcus fulvus]|uniref:putative metal-binding motif-containing protein n=1 Tax=Myxococcus fulvus TaxID=33 RepID=UPI003B9AA5EB
MRRIALFLLPLLVLACSKEQAGTSLVVKYTPSFKEGCFVIKVNDAEGEGVERESKSISELTGAGKVAGNLRVGLLRKDGWPAKVKVTVTAHEKECAGKVVNTRVVDVELGEEGVAKDSKYEVTLTTPDEDGDGYVATTAGGTDCDDNDGLTNISAAEVCDDKDNNCVGGIDEGWPQVAMFRDRDGDGVGGEAVQHCVPVAGVRGYANVGGDCKDDNENIAPGKTEVCDNEDNNCDGNTDEGFDKNWYLDDDGDGVPRAGATVQCDRPGDKFKNYPSGPPFDCNDGNANNAPGKTELCDNEDNNCDGAADETFDTKGDACTNLSCTGVLVCNAAQNGVVCNAQPPRMFYPDKDGDLDGDQGATADEICVGETPQTGWVENPHTDCDDVDPAARAGRAEVCDGIDNDCNGLVDEGLTCGGTLKHVENYHVRFESDDHDWRTVAAHPSGYPVWIAGRGGKLALKKNAGAKFESFSHGDATTQPGDGSAPANANTCGSHNWTAAWVDPSGNVWVGGEGGWLAVHSGTSGFNCIPGTTPGGANITALVGFLTSTGNLVLYITDTTGRLYRYSPGAPTPFTELDDNSVNFYGLHGLQEEFLLAVGLNTGSGNGQRFRGYAVTPGGAATATSHSHGPGNTAGSAKAVWMGASNKACAVGDNGAAWRWDGAVTWTRVDAPGGANIPFTSVVMRSDAQSSPQRLLADQCYTVDGSANGRLRRLTPYGWAKGPDLPASTATVPLNDIAITASGDIWIVGEDGRVFHYPEP